MEETLTNSNGRKSLFSSFLEVLEAREKQAQADRQLQEDKYIRRIQRINSCCERQRKEAVELRRCLDYVSEHAQVLESVLRDAVSSDASSGGESSVALSATLVQQASALHRCMSQCVANTSRIRNMLTSIHRPQMDIMLAKMEAELHSCTSFVRHVVDSTYNIEIGIDNLHNMIAEQRRYVREISSSNVFKALCAGGDDGESGSAEAPEQSAPADAAPAALSPPDRRPPSRACSTPIANE